MLVVAAFAIATAHPNTSFFWLLLGAAAGLSLLVFRIRVPERSCSFCGAERERVTYLVTAPSASICGACAAESSATIADEVARAGQPLKWARLFLSRLPDRAPLQVTRPYVELVAARDPSPAGVRAALCATRRAAPPDGAADPWVLGNSAWYEANLHLDAPREDLERWHRHAAEARRLVEARPPPGTEGTPELARVVAAFLGTEAELARRLGDPEGALRALSLAEERDPDNGHRRMLRARALADLGRTEEARRAAQEALALVHPGTHCASEAERVLEALPAPAPRP